MPHTAQRPRLLKKFHPPTPAKEGKSYVESHIEQFTRRESALEVRARVIGRADILDRSEFRSWQTWIGDSAIYLARLRAAVEDAEAEAARQDRIAARSTERRGDALADALPVLVAVAIAADLI